ncbi:MAG: phosphoribosylpyrophosphate synthetase [Thalassobius sp.]|nr:phosphoribosylpyrophosphate synthetase [Thalassovita sp.]HNP16938.1 phosphoribosylpyrophosphate synthetase [Fulvivirga sp.]
MKNYDTLSEALNDLKTRGYSNDFNLKPHCIECPAHKLELHPEQFEVKEVYRFEGMSNPDDNSILYAIESKDGFKGVLVDAYGVYAEALTEEMIRKLKVVR